MFYRWGLDQDGRPNGTHTCVCVCVREGKILLVFISLQLGLFCRTSVIIRHGQLGHGLTQRCVWVSEVFNWEKYICTKFLVSGQEKHISKWRQPFNLVWSQNRFHSSHSIEERGEEAKRTIYNSGAVLIPLHRSHREARLLSVLSCRVMCVL